MKAFPSEYTETKGGNKFGPHTVTITNTGMDLRDYFAAKAMQGYLSCKGWHPDFNMQFDKEYAKNGVAHEIVTEVCYKWADAMMKAREQ